MIKKIVPYYLIAILFSWSLFVVTDAWLIPKYAGTGFVKLIALYGHMLAMLGPFAAGIISLKFILKKKTLTFKAGDQKYYSYAIYGAIILWILPAIIWFVFDKGVIFKTGFNYYDKVFIVTYLAFGWVAGMGEEYGWSAYLLSEISETAGRTRAVIISGILRGLWHLPLFIIPVYLKAGAGSRSLIMMLIIAAALSLQLIISNIFFSSLFGYVWYETESIPLLGWMHFLFDIGRDFALLFFIGFNGSLWFKIGWGIPFYLLAYLALYSIYKKEGFSRPAEVFGIRQK